MTNFNLIQEKLLTKQAELHDLVIRNILNLPSEPGIYIIYNTLTGQSYFGQSVNIQKRLRQHVLSLRSDKHCNRKLQRAFKKHGENAFIGCAMQICSLEMLDELESKYIKYYKSHKSAYGYNCQKKYC